jgi:hypothetical protein
LSAEDSKSLEVVGLDTGFYLHVLWWRLPTTRSGAPKVQIVREYIMKYVMFVRQGQLVPIIFPDFINHKDVVNAASHIFALSTAAPATAGTCEIYCTSTSGKSTSTELPSNPEDAQTINVYDYCHGHEPPTAEIATLVRQAFENALKEGDDAAIDDLFDRSDWPPDKLRDVHRETAAKIFGVPESEVTPEQRARARTINYSTIYGGAQKVPHDYVPTDPYKGCGECGFGPGAAVHNSHEVRRHREKTDS